MTMYRTKIYSVFLAVIFINAGPAVANETRVLATIQPVQLIVSELLRGLDEESSSLLPAGMTPHDYALKISDMKRVKAAKLMLWLGPEVEPYLVKMMGNKSSIEALNIRMLEGIEHLPLRSLAGGHHHHREESARDPHTWLAPNTALQIATVLVARLSKVDAQNAAIYQQNLASFKQNMEKLDRYKGVFLHSGAEFVVHHDAYQYLEAFMGLTPSAVVTVEPEVSPGVRHLTEVAQTIKAKQISCLVGGPALPPRLAFFLFKGRAADSYRVIKLDPLAGGGFESYSAFMEDLASRLAQCVSGES